MKTPHINKINCKRFLLEYAQDGHRYHKFTRVSGEVFEMLETKLCAIMRGIVDSAPSKGKTLK
jgi:hypothetical protein